MVRLRERLWQLKKDGVHAVASANGLNRSLTYSMFNADDSSLIDSFSVFAKSSTAGHPTSTSLSLPRIGTSSWTIRKGCSRVTSQSNDWPPPVLYSSESSHCG